MDRGFRRGFTTAEKTELWDRWQRGESLKAIGRAFGKPSSSIYFQVSPYGGIRPAPRRRSRLALTLSEREEISRGIAVRRSARSMAGLLGRSPSTVSREISRNGGYDGYRAALADDKAWARARRPKRCKSPEVHLDVGSKLQIRKGPDADARQQDLVLGVGHRIADVLVQQIVAKQADDHFAGSEPGWIEFGLVADLRLQQIIARRGRLADGSDVVLRKGVQQVDAHEPVAVAPVEAAADAHWWNPGHVGAVGEGGADDVELVLDAPDTAIERPDVELALEFGAAERGVALRINRLPQVEPVGIGNIHTSGTTVACVAVQPAEDEAVELGVIAG